MSRFMTAIPISATIGNPLSASLLRLDGRSGLAGWQWLFLIEGIPSVLLGVAVLWFLTDRHEDAHWLSGAQRNWLAARLRRDGEESPAAHGLPPLRALAHPMVWLISLLYFLVVTTGYCYTFWAPIMIRDALNASNTATALITGLIAFVAAAVMVVVGGSSDRTNERYVHAAACGGLIALGCVGAALLPHPLGRVAGLALVPIGVWSFLAPFWCLPTMLLRGSAAAAGIALINSLGNLGGFVGPYVVGLLKDATGGTTGSFLALAAIALGAAALCLVLRRRAATAFPAGTAGRAMLDRAPVLGGKM
jgi:ACS family tartrate transporter-like MFS transporter